MTIDNSIDTDIATIQHLLRCARGEQPCELVLKNASIINVFSKEIIAGDVGICGNRIAGIGCYQGEHQVDLNGKFISPGFIEGHIHIESSMLSPVRFAEAVIPRGTTTVICDPHEIANVLGLKGIQYMLDIGKDLPVDIVATAPSCVPATDLETSGATLSSRDIAGLLDLPEVVGLGEMMNFPGTIFGDEQVLAKLDAARQRNMVIDGHAPGVGGSDLQAYCAAAISSDHECTALEEAREKLRAGMYIFIREGSTAKNLEALLPLVTAATCRRFLLVSDDRHPDDLVDKGHLDAILRKAVTLGLDPISALQMVTINPAERFGLTMRGAVAPGYMADLVVLDNLNKFTIDRVYKNGRPVYQDGRCLDFDAKRFAVAGVDKGDNSVHIDWSKVDFRIPVHQKKKKIRVITCIEDQIVTNMDEVEPAITDGYAVADPDRDLLKISVIERHHAGGGMSNGFVRGFGFSNGAIASTVAHDSHNLVIVGSSDNYMLTAARLIAEAGGGICVVTDNGSHILPLPVAGLMSNQASVDVAQQLTLINEKAKTMGVRITNPFMLLSFLALPVIPTLKITDRGLVNVLDFKIVSLWV